MSENLNPILSTAGVLTVIVAFVAAVIGGLERTHRRTQQLPHLQRTPFDAEHDRDLARTLEELRAAPAGQPGRRIRPVS